MSSVGLFELSEVNIYVIRVDDMSLMLLDVYCTGGYLTI